MEDYNDFKQDHEKRLTVVESWKESMQVEIVARLMEQVCHRINKNPESNLPKLGKSILDIKELEGRFKRKEELDWLEKKEREEVGAHSFEIIKGL